MNFKVLFFVLVIIFALTSATFGVFYFLKNKAYTELQSSYQALMSKPAKTTDTSNLTTQIATLTQEKADAQKAKTDAETALANEKANEALAQKYNDVFSYVLTVVDTHQGLDGWTDAEYQAGRTLAEKTGDAEFLSTVDWAWQHKEVSQITRLVRALRYISDKIKEKLQ